MLIDSHCHLNYPEFADVQGVLARAEQAGVGCMQTISTKRSDFAEVKALTQEDARIYGSIGIHPHEAEAHPDITVEELVEEAGDPRIIGIGETGLDYYYEHSPKAAQQRSFRMHIEAARQTGLPVIVHSRDADEDTVAILQEEYAKDAFPGLIHCFSTSKYLAEETMKIGFYISISGIITFKKSEALRAIVRDLPLERLLIETDAPYLAPAPHRGKPNEPAFVRHVAECLADVKGVSLEEIEMATTENFFTLFNRIKR